jgi:hypothetical protein
LHEHAKKRKTEEIANCKLDIANRKLAEGRGAGRVGWRHASPLASPAAQFTIYNLQFAICNFFFFNLFFLFKDLTCP